MHPTLTIATRAARKAGLHIKRAFERIDEIKVSQKGPNDYVTEVDKKAELILIEALQQSYPTHGFLAEESGEHPGDEHTWIIDPIDGTTNFIHGYPYFCISMALRVGDKIEHGLIYNPISDDLFLGSRGGGAFLNERRIRVREQRVLSEALVGLCYSKRSLPPSSDGLLREFNTQSGGVRRAGSSALDLAYVAAGRLDAAYQYGMKIWDIAAGGLLVTEAGGHVVDVSGEDYLKSGHLIASNLKLMPLMETLVKGSGKAGNVS